MSGVRIHTATVIRDSFLWLCDQRNSAPIVCSMRTIQINVIHATRQRKHAVIEGSIAL